jgi:uncharacterized protein
VSIRIDESFEVRADPQRVWEFLLDLERVVVCLPGAELLGADEDGSFRGRVKVKVGPVTVAYRGRARFEEIDEVAKRVRVRGEGQETTGAGAAKMSMVSIVEALAGGRTAVRVESEVDVVGRVVQFGRGMIEEVSRQLFRQFAQCVTSALEAAGPTETSAPLAEPGGVTAGRQAGADVAAGTPAGAEAARTPTGGPGAKQATPLRIIPVMFAALRSRIARFFRWR